MIQLQSVSKTYDDGATYAVREVSFEVPARTLLVLVGESGSGKTTTLKIINRLIEPSAGRVEIDGKDLRDADPVALRRRIGYVFQGIGLFPHWTIAENIATVPRLLQWPAARTAERVDELLELVNLPNEFAGRRPHELSGGQQQRVGVARALAARPSVMLMDEPFGAVDPITRDALRLELKALQAALGLTIVLVTHDVTEALLLGDRIAVMQDGRLLAHDTPGALMAAPPHPYVKRLLDMPRRQADQVEAIARGKA